MDLRDLADMGNGDLNRCVSSRLTCPAMRPFRPKLARLRAGGVIVVVDLPGHEASRAELGCEQQLVPRAGAWKIEPLN